MQLVMTERYLSAADRLSKTDRKSLCKCERGLEAGTKPTRRLMASGKLEARATRDLRVVLEKDGDSFRLLDVCTHDELKRRW